MIDRFRVALEHHGIDTGSWWQRQLDLCMIGVMAAFGWEKALGDTRELSWWETTDRRRRPGRRLADPRLVHRAQGTVMRPYRPVVVFLASHVAG